MEKTVNIFNMIRKASSFELFLVSFLSLPFIFDAWLTVTEKLQLEVTIKYWFLGAVFLFYVFGVGLMYKGNSRDKRREIARDLIIQHLTKSKFERMSYEKIREKINKTYCDKFLDSLVTAFPNDLRKANIKGGKLGLARIPESESEEDAV